MGKTLFMIQPPPSVIGSKPPSLSYHITWAGRNYTNKHSRGPLFP